MATWGIVLSALGLVLSVGLGYFYYQGMKAYQKAMESIDAPGGMALKDWRGVRAPDFSVTTLEGNVIKLEDSRIFFAALPLPIKGLDSSPVRATGVEYK